MSEKSISGNLISGAAIGAFFRCVSELLIGLDKLGSLEKKFVKYLKPILILLQ